VIARAHFDTVRLPTPPAAIQRAALAVGAPVGKALGYEATRKPQRPISLPRPHSRPARNYDRGRPHDRPARTR
jgi:hypothetical protein